MGFWDGSGINWLFTNNLLQTDNHANTSSLNFYHGNTMWSSCCPTNSVNALKAHSHHTRHTNLFNGPFSGTTQVSRYQKGKINLDFTGARDGEWQWHQLGHMRVCTSLQTDNQASTPPLSHHKQRQSKTETGSLTCTVSTTDGLSPVAVNALFTISTCHRPHTHTHTQV